jgi:hypothetical protein
VVKSAVSCFLADFILKLVDRTWGFDRFDFPTTRADEVVTVLTGLEEGEKGGSLVEAKAADDAVLAKTLKKTIDRGLVALIGKALRSRELGERHGSIYLDQGGNEFLERFRAAETCFPAAGDG